MRLEDYIIYKDDSLIVINKPPGIAVHRGRGSGDNLEQYLNQLSFGSPTPPIPAHRLDKDTSGCLILGRHKAALSKIGKMFMAKRINKTYWAIVEGDNFENKEGRIKFPLRKISQLGHNWWMEVNEEGKEAITDYKIIKLMERLALIELRPHTGRTHQLRIHCKSIGHPILGDKIYGNGNNIIPLHLHARSISIPQHDKKPIYVTADVPEWWGS